MRARLTWHSASAGGSHTANGEQTGGRYPSPNAGRGPSTPVYKLSFQIREFLPRSRNVAAMSELSGRLSLSRRAWHHRDVAGSRGKDAKVAAPGRDSRLSASTPGRQDSL